MDRTPQPYIEYYGKQAGGGGFPVFRGLPVQRGHGLLGSLAKIVRPLIKPVISMLRKTAFKTGIDVVGDVGKGVPLPTALKRRAAEAGAGLIAKTGRFIQRQDMSKPALKRKARPKRPSRRQNALGKGRRQLRRPITTQKPADIFS